MITGSDPVSTHGGSDGQQPEGWEGLPGGATHDTAEGPGDHLARGVVAQVEQVRRQAGLSAGDKIALHLSTSSHGLREAIDSHRHFICKATLAVQPSSQPLSGEGIVAAEVSVEGHPLRVEVRRVTVAEPMPLVFPETGHAAPEAAPKPAKKKPAAKKAPVKVAKPAKKAPKAKAKPKPAAKKTAKPMAAAKKTVKGKPKAKPKPAAKAKAKKAPAKKAAKAKGGKSRR